LLANRAVMKNQPVHIDWMDRIEAEKKYDSCSIRGACPPGREIRILRVGSDVEACGGTHVSNTGLIGPIKAHKDREDQDGVERIRVLGR